MQLGFRFRLSLHHASYEIPEVTVNLRGSSDRRTVMGRGSNHH